MSWFFFKFLCINLDLNNFRFHGCSSLYFLSFPIIVVKFCLRYTLRLSEIFSFFVSKRIENLISYFMTMNYEHFEFLAKILWYLEITTTSLNVNYLRNLCSGVEVENYFGSICRFGYLVNSVKGFTYYYSKLLDPLKSNYHS